MLTLPADVHAEMVSHALTGLPYEACGLFVGAFGSEIIEQFHPMTNAAASSVVYQLDGAELLEVEKQADAAGLAVLGVMHSHTHTSAYPSPTDVEDAARFDPFGAWIFIIVSLKHPEPALRAYRIVDGDITELPIEVTARLQS